MDSHLRCNNQIGDYCRRQLKDRAVVTTCSHIFCIDCAKRVGLLNAPLDQRHCPICKSSLPHQDDAAETSLAPTEEYKTSVLSGLDPTTIMECAGRALAFWTYQTTQEILYQEYLGKSLTEKYKGLSIAMDKLVNEANAEVQSLQNKVNALSVDQKTLQQKNAELVDLYREKSRKQAQIQHMYDTLKKKVMANQIQSAASEDVTRALNAITSTPRPQTLISASRLDPSKINQSQHIHPSTSSFFRHDHNFTSVQHGKAVQSVTPANRASLPHIPRLSANRSRIPVHTLQFDAGGHRVATSFSRSPLHRQSNHHQNENHHNAMNSPTYGAISGAARIGGIGTAHR